MVWFASQKKLESTLRDWRGTFTPVPMEGWVDLQVYKNDAWTTPPCFVGVFG